MAQKTGSSTAKSRAATRARRRRQLIDSTIDSIAKRGFSETKMADVAEGAGLSQGIVNFHFKSKKMLFVETLRYLDEEYRESWTIAVAKAGDDPAAQLAALVRNDFNPKVCNRKKIAVWYAFWGEAKSRPTYLDLCGAGDRQFGDCVRSLCTALKVAGSYRRCDPVLVADGLCAMLLGLWQDLLITPKSFDRERAVRTCFAYLALAFPRHFPLERAAAA